jgi:hypothetical protein
MKFPRLTGTAVHSEPKIAEPRRTVGQRTLPLKRYTDPLRVVEELARLEAIAAGDRKGGFYAHCLRGLV